MRLSPSALSTFRDCPRCFWLEKNKKVRRPRGIYPSLPSGMDKIIKEFYDAHRVNGTVPELIEKNLPGVELYPDMAKLKKWRHWRSTDLRVKISDIYTLSGAVDDVLLDGDIVIPYDYKTRGYPYKDPADALKYYQLQMDCYALMLLDHGFDVWHSGYLGYYIPTAVEDNGLVEFDTALITVPVEPDRAIEVCNQAIECIEGPEPEPNGGCEYCSYVDKVAKATEKGGKVKWKTK